MTVSAAGGLRAALRLLSSTNDCAAPTTSSGLILVARALAAASPSPSVSAGPSEKNFETNSEMSASSRAPKALSKLSAWANSASSSGNSSKASLTFFSTRNPASALSNSKQALSLAPETLGLAASSSSNRFRSSASSRACVAASGRANARRASKSGGFQSQPSCCLWINSSAWRTLPTSSLTSASCICQTRSNFCRSVTSKCLNFNCKSR
mmetsp:Transcript_20915/g.54501  ORF Transcript_20915/g.54501 Transcript_20915/m.54501 type:complete len:210 (+) Transcript_20915:358-987(+)